MQRIRFPLPKSGLLEIGQGQKRTVFRFKDPDFSQQRKEFEFSAHDSANSKRASIARISLMVSPEKELQAKMNLRCVTPCYRRTMLAQSFFLHLENVLRAHGVKRVFMVRRKGLDELVFFTAMGYKPYGQRSIQKIEETAKSNHELWKAIEKGYFSPTEKNFSRWLLFILQRSKQAAIRTTGRFRISLEKRL